MSDPDWSLLPGEPLKFFSLPEKYDRKALKRSYGRLIKQFKPEGFPDEFRKIRDAYEKLEKWLKYREPSEERPILPQPGLLEITFSASESNPELIEQLSLPLSGSPQEFASSQPALTVLPSVQEILELHSPEEWYEQLKIQPDKSAEDFVRLAFLSDVASPEDSEKLFFWICQGLKAHPEDAGLNQLAYQYVRKIEELTGAEHVLEELCHALPTSRLMYVTEPLWDMLLKKKFHSFCRLWEQHVAPQREMYAPYFVPFIVQSLTAACWKDDQSWLNDQLAFIESHYDLIYGSHDYQLEMYQVLTEYLAAYGQMRQANPNALIPLNYWHQQMKSHCLSPLATRHLQWASLHKQLLQSVPEWSENFLTEDPSHFQLRLVRTWEWLALTDRLQNRRYTPQLPDDQAQRCSRDWLYQLQDLSGSEAMSHLRQKLFVPIVFLIGLVVVSFVMPDVYYEYSMHFVLWFLILSGIVIRILFASKEARLEFRKAYYQQKIRQAAMAFFKRTRVTHWQFCAAMRDWLTAGNQQLKKHHLVFGDMIEKDPVLIIYRTALDYED